MTKQQRQESLLPNGIPRYIRVYDNPEVGDRYTVVFTGNYRKVDREFHYLGMSAHPFHPQGIGQHGETNGQPCDRPSYGHLGKKISWQDLPEDCQKCALSTYRDIWDLN